LPATSGSRRAASRLRAAAGVGGFKTGLGFLVLSLFSFFFVPKSKSPCRPAGAGEAGERLEQQRPPVQPGESSWRRLLPRPASECHVLPRALRERLGNQARAGGLWLCICGSPTLTSGRRVEFEEVCSDLTISLCSKESRVRHPSVDPSDAKNEMENTIGKI
jgi:hypothetical protein